MAIFNSKLLNYQRVCQLQTADDFWSYHVISIFSLRDFRFKMRNTHTHTYIYIYRENRNLMLFTKRNHQPAIAVISTYVWFTIKVLTEGAFDPFSSLNAEDWVPWHLQKPWLNGLEMAEAMYPDFKSRVCQTSFGILYLWNLS